MDATRTQSPISRSDRTALWITITVGAVAAVYTFVSMVLRIGEIIPNRNVPVPAAFADTPATLPIGPDGAAVPVVVEQAIIRVSDMPAITLASLLLAAVISAVATIAAIVCVCLFCRNLIRGRAFDKTNVRLIGTATLVIAVGWAVGSLFRTMGANGASAMLSHGAAANTAFPVDYAAIAAIVSLAAIGVAFQQGHRLQRDTEGLV